MSKKKCTCGKLAVWILMSGNDPVEDFKCDNCVPRGCTCNEYPIDEDWYNEDPNNWKEEVGEDGRLFPCCEWFYDEEGFE